MLEQFEIRNLSVTVDFLCRTGLADDGAQTLPGHRSARMPDEALAAAQQQLGHPLAGYKALLCPVSAQHPRRTVLCGCCGALRTFLRNHCLLLHTRAAGKNSDSDTDPHLTDTFKINGKAVVYGAYRSDPFNDFVVAAVNKDRSMLLDVISAVPLFWEALVLLCDITDEFITVPGPLAPYFYMLLKVRKDIDPPGFSADYVRGIPPSLDTLPYTVASGNPNLLAAFFFACGDPDSAHDVFNRVFFPVEGTDDQDAAPPPENQNSDNAAKRSALAASLISNLKMAHNISFEYSDIAAFVLFTKNDPKLPFFVEILKSDFSGKPETYTAMGIHQTSLGKYALARGCFRKALRLRKDPDVLCMLGHTHIHVQEKTEAISCFAEALQHCPRNFRLLYTIAQGYFILDMAEHALFYCRRALTEKSDGSIWKLAGRIHMRLKDFQAAAHALEKAVRMGEHDALLYLAELAKKTQRPEIAAGLYERYVQVGEKNRSVVLKYLVEHFDEVGDVEKCSMYRSMLL